MSFDELMVMPDLDGKIEVVVKSAIIKKDKKGEPNYQFVLQTTQDERVTVNFNCGKSFINGVLANIRRQIGDNKVYTASELITLAKTKPFNIWIVDRITYFYDREKYLEEYNASHAIEGTVEL